MARCPAKAAGRVRLAAGVGRLAAGAGRLAAGRAAVHNPAACPTGGLFAR
ncbi:hypothetical protein [Nocardia sp. NPDC019255]